jgi:hypothetical protein
MNYVQDICDDGNKGHADMDFLFFRGTNQNEA